MPSPQPSSKPTVFVLFGATGDLAKRMVLPAFYQLAQHGLMPDVLVAGRQRARRHRSRGLPGRVRSALDEFGGLTVDEEIWSISPGTCDSRAVASTRPIPGSLLDVLTKRTRSSARTPNTSTIWPFRRCAFETMTKGLAAASAAGRSQGRLREAVRHQPRVVQGTRRTGVVGHEGGAGLPDRSLPRQGGHPEPARAPFREPMVGQIWSREHVQQIQIDVPETLDVSDRAAFYDATGALRDMVVTHLFQVAAEIAMEPPIDSQRRKSAGCAGVGAGRVPSAGARGRRARARRTATRTCRKWRTARPRTPMPRFGSGWTPTAGTACRSCCAAASTWPRVRSGSRSC